MNPKQSERSTTAASFPSAKSTETNAARSTSFAPASLSRLASFVSKICALALKLKPKGRVFLRYCATLFSLRALAGLLGVLAGLRFLASYRQLFAGHSWVPLILALIAIALDIALRIGHGAKEMPGLPGWWPGWLQLLGLCAGWGVALVTGTLFLPEVRQELRFWDHGWTAGIAPLSGGIGLAQRGDFYDVDEGPRLLLDDAATQRRLEAFTTNPERFPLIEWRGDYALLYAALRAQGYSDEKILTLPVGRYILIGTLCADCVPPYWDALASDWISRTLLADPHGGLRLGWVHLHVVRALITEMLEKPELLTADLLRALLFIAGYAPEVFPTGGQERLLACWAQSSPSDQEAILAIARVRTKIASLLTRAGHDPEVPLTFSLLYPALWQPETQAATRDAVARFLALCGSRIEWVEVPSTKADPWMALANQSTTSTSTKPRPSAAQPRRPIDGADRAAAAEETHPPSATQEPTLDGHIFITLRSGLFERVRYITALPESRLLPSVEKVWLTSINNENDEIQAVEVPRPSLRYVRPVTMKETIGSARLLELRVRIECGGKDVEVVLPWLGPLNIDIARSALKVLDETSPAEENVAALNVHTRTTLLAPWRLGLPEILQEGEIARWDATPAP